MRDAFPELRAALSAHEPVPDSTLATAIMLASLEIISPNTFDVPISWQNHLQVARQIIISRGGLETLSSTGDGHLVFLSKWFAYLEVLGSLSGSKSTVEPISGDFYASLGLEQDPSSSRVDCFLGVTTQCISLLAQVAKLAHQCDAERVDAQCEIDPAWRPSSQVMEEAEKLRHALMDSMTTVHEACMHNDPSQPTEEKSPQDIQEIQSCNAMYHWAGLIHLYRRVMGRLTADADVQQCVQSVVNELKKISRGSTTEGCLLFPMFTAGCDALDNDHRGALIERLKGVEGWGMTHVLKARTLMQKVWETGKPWETLVAGEFFG